MVFTLLPYKAIGAADRASMKRVPAQLKLAQTANAPRGRYGKMKKLMKPEKLFSTDVPEMKLVADVKRGANYVPTIISSSRDAYAQLKKMYDPDTINLQEEFIIMTMNRRNEVLSYYKLSKGGMTGTVVDTRMLFIAILLSGSTGVILSHNHPSGNLKPSPEDEGITRRIQEAGKLLDIHIHDHLILTDDGYYSFADNGKM